MGSVRTLVVLLVYLDRGIHFETRKWGHHSINLRVSRYYQVVTDVTHVILADQMVVYIENM